MAISRTEICNKALTLVGANPIVSIDDDTQNARVVNRVYELSLKSILSEAPWVFALRRSLLALSTDTLEWYDNSENYVYARPNEVIRIFRTNDRDAIWRVQGDYIISDTDDLGVEYVYYNNTPSSYTASFVEAFVDKLCSDIAFMILNSKTVAENFLEKYEKVSLSKALAENAQIGTPQMMKDDAWDRAKTSGYTDRADLSFG
uniref:Putative tail protein n=1 Tax=viral metagenome TaxID=1070528 RepID=A0A6M3L139_9ZZZZ